jgi:serine protease SohB
MAMFLDVLGFALKGAVVVIATLIVVGGLAAVARHGRQSEPRIVVRELNRRFRALSDTVRSAVLGRKPFRTYVRAMRKQRKARGPAGRRIYVLDFHGDIAASAAACLREEVSALLPIAAPDKDEVVVRLESSGGLVHAYGLAASELARVRAKGVRLVVCVDKVAASGGYMMACVADEIVAAPFAMIGSIGVVASVPNLNRLLERHGIDYEEMTAGEFKRTISFLGKISPEGRQKFKEQIEDTHVLFKEFVAEHRPGLDIARVSTGEYWFAKRALELKLVDRLSTSDDYLLSQVETADIYQVAYKPPQGWRQKVTGAASDLTERLLDTWLSRAQDRGLV